MEYVILEAGGRQYWVENKKFFDVNNLNLKSGSKILIRRVLFGRKNDAIFIGQPYANIKVEAIVKKDFLAPKVIVYKMKPKKKYRRKKGHRQQFTRMFIEKITY